MAVASILFWRKRRLAFGLLVSSTSSLFILSLPPLARTLTRSLEDQYPDRDSSEIPSAQSENALLSYRLPAPGGITKIILVTSAFHMPRAVGAFRKAGFEVIPAPAEFHTGWAPPRAFERWVPSVNSIRESDRALHEMVGLWVYRFRGWA
jgi:uncharacterized SAM-binding protein YcdF (DUF218 family)